MKSYENPINIPLKSDIEVPWTWIGKCPVLGILDITFKYVLEIQSPIVGWCWSWTFTCPPNETRKVGTTATARLLAHVWRRPLARWTPVCSRKPCIWSWSKRSWVRNSCDFQGFVLKWLMLVGSCHDWDWIGIRLGFQWGCNGTSRMGIQKDLSGISWNLNRSWWDLTPWDITYSTMYWDSTLNKTDRQQCSFPVTSFWISRITTIIFNKFKKSQAH